jgi:Parvulin-like peptidyl-prolyl isomerase
MKWFWLIRSIAINNTIMLSSIRNKTKGWLAYLIVGLITVPFALFGINEYFTGASNVIVASIDGDEISKEAFLSEFNPQKRRLQQRLSERYDTEFDSILKQSVINDMINKRLLGQFSNDLDYATTNSELQALIQSNNLFQTDGRFSIEGYQKLLRLNGYSTAEYEAIKLKELTQSQIKYNLLDSAFVTSSALKKLQALNEQQREFNYIQIDADSYLDKVKVDAKSVEGFYNNQKESFFDPQKIKIDFIELSLEKIAKNIEVNDDDLFNFYEDEKERFSTEGERKAQHILVETKEQAQTVIELINKGGDFSKLAKEYSIDTGSKDDAGDLGFFTKGVMVPEFEEKVFSMQEGSLSGAVKSEFGYHIIKLNQIKLGSIKSFDSVRSELTKLYTQTLSQKSLYNLTDQLANLAYEVSLDEVSDQMNLAINTTQFFAKNTTDYEQKFVDVAFSDVVLNKGENSEVIELSKDKFVVVRLKEKLAKRQKSFDEVKGEINKHLTTLLAKTFVDKIAKDIATSLINNDDSANKLMDKNKLKWSDSVWAKRDSKTASVAIINKLFALPKPSEGQSVYSAQGLGKRSAVVIQLSTVKAPDYKPNKGLERSLLSFESNEMFAGILKTLRSNAEIKVFADRL